MKTPLKVQEGIEVTNDVESVRGSSGEKVSYRDNQNCEGFLGVEIWLGGELEIPVGTR
jgi:hypothetical protein